MSPVDHKTQATIAEWLKKAVSELTKVGFDSSRLDSLLLLECVLKKPRERILAHDDFEITADDRIHLDKMLTQRINHIPLAYIIGSKEFYGRDFLVNDAVLIPRPESEAIIDLLKQEVIRQAQDEKLAINTIIDIGTGSGCLAITAKLLFPDIHVRAIDNSKMALKVAKSNARKYGAQIQFKTLDIYHGLPSMPKTRPFVMLVNLPYVPSNLITSEEILKEPPQALFSGTDGMDHYKEFWKQINKLKNKPVCILTESLTTQHEQMIDCAKTSGYKLVRSCDLIQQFVLI